MPTRRATRRSTLACLAAACLVAVLLPTRAGAQGEDPAQQVSTPSEPGVEAVPITAIGVVSERDKRIVREMADSLAPSEAVAAVQDRLPELEGDVDEAVRRSTDLLEGDPRVVELRRQASAWQPIIGGLEEAQVELRARSEEVGRGLEVAGEKDAIWKATKQATAEADPLVLEQIGAVAATIDQVIAKGRERQAAILELQSRVARLHETALSDIDRLDQARIGLTGSPLEQAEPPIWSQDFWSVPEDSIRGELEAYREDRLDAQERLDALRRLWERKRETVILHAIATVIFGILMFYVRPFVNLGVRDDEEIAQIQALFAGPISLTLVASFVVAYSWIVPVAPALEPMLMALALIPSVLILRRLLPPTLFPMLNALVVLFLYERAYVLFVPPGSLSRVFALLEFTAVGALVLFWLRPSRLAQVPPEVARSRALRTIGLGLRIALVACGIGILAEAAGHTTLSYLLGRTVTMSGYAAAVLYGAVRVVGGVVYLLLRVRPLTLLGMVRRNRPLIERRAAIFIRVAAALLWLDSVLGAAGVRNDVEGSVRTVLDTPLPLREVAITVGDVVAAAATFYAATLLSRLIRFILEEDVYRRIRLPKGRPYAISTLLHYTLLIVGFLLATTALGFDLNRFTLLAGAFGVGIGFGLQGIVNNFVSGIILLTERPVEVGDTISIEGVFGRVDRIGIRSSTVRTWQGAEIIVPNADLVAQQVTNWTLSDRRRRLEIPVGVSYGSDPHRVIEVLKQVALDSDRVLEYPDPEVLFMGFGESSLDFELRAFTDEFDVYFKVRSGLMLGISDALRAAEIEIPFPQRDLHVKSIVASES